MARVREKRTKDKSESRKVFARKKTSDGEKKRLLKLPKASRGGLIDNVISNTLDMNYKILGLVLLLTFYGIMAVQSASCRQAIAYGSSTYFMTRQIIFAVSGLVLLFIAANFDYHKYDRWAFILISVSILLLVAVLLFGSSTNGAQRWIGIGAFRITPSEFSKLFVIIYTSVFLAGDPKRIKGKYVWFLMGIMIIHFLLIVKQPNLSTAIVLCAIMIGIMFVAGLDLRWFAFFGGLAVLGTVLILTVFKSSHWYSRLTSFIDPFADAQDTGYQVTQGLIALGNGGLKGLGIGNSITKNLYLPEPQNDFILAIIGEETGFIGFMLLMAVYIILFYECIMTAAKAKDRLGFYLAAGVSIMLGLQVVVNVAVVTSSMPATGITLPFVSYGGTSIWVFMIAMGIVLNVSRGQANKPLKGASR